MKKEKAALDLVLERVSVARNDVDHRDIAVVRVDLWEGWRSLAIVTTTFSRGDDVTSFWVKEFNSMLRQHRLRAPLVVGLVALRGRAPSGSPCNPARARGHPQRPVNPIRCISVCVGGSHAIVYQPDCNVHRKHIGGPLAFDGDNKMKRIREMLSDKRVTVACVGAAEVAKNLAEQWGLYVARPVELTDLFARAYGKAAGVDPLKPPRQLASQGTPSESGWIPKAIGWLRMEYMARVALGSEMRLAPTPKKVAAADWGGRDLGCDEWMYATRDAYLCFDIAAHCLPKLGARVA